MRQDNRRIREFLQMVLEAALIVFSYLAAVFVRFQVFRGTPRFDYDAPASVLLIVAYALLTVFIFYGLSHYKLDRHRHFRDILGSIWLVQALSVLTFTGYLFLRHEADFSRFVLWLFWLFACLTLSAWRALLRALRLYTLRRHPKHVLLIGSGQQAAQYLIDLKKAPHLGIDVIGYYAKASAGLPVPYLGDYGEFTRSAASHDPWQIVVALEPQEIPVVPQILATADKEGFRVSLIPFYNAFYPSHPIVDSVGQTKLIDMRSTPLDNLLAASIKRLIDILGALALIALTSPIMLLVALGVRLSSPGPILFRQERIGRDKKPFQMLKFRSMRITGTESTGWTTDADRRKTRFGAFIRKFSLDELPQFFNVLSGNMSLIGPRPEVPHHVQHFREEIPRYLVRQQVRPGITGWAQVNGLRGDTSIAARVEYDIWYIENWSLMLDFKILLMTVFGGMINREKITV